MPKELFQVAVLLAGTCTQALHAPTNGSIKDIVEGYAGVFHWSQRAIPLGEQPRTHLTLLAPQPVLVEMT